MDKQKEFIMDRLKLHYEYAKKQLGLDYKDRILGVFAYGSMNYNFFKFGESDVDSKLIIIPSFEDMCLKQEWLSKELHFEGEHIEVKDIRELKNMFIKQNINYLEILYTNYFILNPRFEALWRKYFIDNREAIVHYDRQKAMKSISGQLIHTLKQDPMNNKKLHNAHRLYYFLKHYLNNEIYLDCIAPTGEDYTFLRELKFGLNELSQNAEAKLALASTLEQKVYDLIAMYPNLDSPLHETAAAALNNGVVEIIKFSQQDPVVCVTKEEFFKKITNAEQRAYYSIVKEIGTEGEIAISKLIKKNAISRPVYTNLIIKLKEYGVAEVANKGIKGTYLKIIQPELRAEAFDYS